MTSKIPLDSYSILYTVSGKWNLNVKANSDMHNKGPEHFFFLMDKSESLMINPNIATDISYDINSHTFDLLMIWSKI